MSVLELAEIKMKKQLKKAFRALGFDVVRATTVPSMELRIDELMRECKDLQLANQNLQGDLNACWAGLSRPLAQGIIDAHIGRYTPPFTPDRIRDLCRAYDKVTDPVGQEQISRTFMQRVIVDPAIGGLLLVNEARPLAISHPLFRQMQSAIAFADGKLEKARDILRELAREYASAFNILCLARTLKAMDNESEAVTVLREGIELYPTDLFLVMELATSYARVNRMERATGLLLRVIDAFAEERKQLEPLQREIEDAIEQKRLEKAIDQDIYNEDFVIGSWWYYWQSYAMHKQYQDGDSSLDHALRREVTNLLRQSNITPTTFVDFGAFCAYTIVRLAQEFPEVHFVGVDRAEVVKELNERMFSRTNVEFIAGDIIDYLTRVDLGETPVLFHARTACFCYPEYLAKLYQTSRERGIKHIMCGEANTLSRWLLHFHAQGEYPQVSVAARGSTFQHDYKRLLSSAGYSIQAAPSVQPTLLLDDRSGFGCDHRLYYATPSV